MKIRPVGVKLFNADIRTDGQTGRLDGDNSRVLQFRIKHGFPPSDSNHFDSCQCKVRIEMKGYILDSFKNADF